MPNPTGAGGKPFTKDDSRASECGKKSKRKSLDARLREQIENDGTLTDIIDVLKNMSLGGDIQAIKELFDRTYGKAKQSIELGNADDTGLKINIIKKNAND
jgi:hypothetical protein